MADLEQQVQQIVNAHVAPVVNQHTTPSARQAPGGIAGVYIAGQAFYFPYGYINSAGDAPTPDTVFGLGSITKTFTTAILGQTPGLFDAPVRFHTPPGIDLRWPEIPTFQQLATFTGGILPSSPTGVTTQDDFVQFLNNVPYPLSGLPAPSIYSDTSVGLLGQTLMNLEGFTSYGADETLAWFRRHLLDALGMTSTVPLPTGNPQLADAYMFDQGTYRVTDYDGWCPWGAAGRMFSTASDMVRFIQGAVGEPVIGGNPVPPAVLAGLEQSLQPWAVLHPPTACAGLAARRQALAWIVWNPEPMNGVVFQGKDGGIAGISAYVAVNPQYRYGVILMTNMYGVPVQCPVISMMQGLLPLAIAAAQG